MDSMSWGERMRSVPLSSSTTKLKARPPGCRRFRHSRPERLLLLATGLEFSSEFHKTVDWADFLGPVFRPCVPACEPASDHRSPATLFSRLHTARTSPPSLGSTMPGEPPSRTATPPPFSKPFRSTELSAPKPSRPILTFRTSSLDRDHLAGT